MAHFASAARHLAEDYARGSMTAAELLEEIRLLDEGYFSLYGEEFKSILTAALTQETALSIPQQVTALVAFYEAFYDQAVALEPSLVARS